MARVVWALSAVIICAKLVEGQRRQFLEDVIQRIRGYPRHRSSSPSWGGERQFEIIGTGRLPIQDQRYGSKLEDGRKGLEITARPGYRGRNKQFYDRSDLEKIDRYQTFFIDSQEGYQNQDFPAFKSFYLGHNFKQRKKRSAGNSPFYHPIIPRRRPRQGLGRMDFHQQNIDRFDDGGFWDDEDFDGDIFGLRNVGSHHTQPKRKVNKQQWGRGDRRQQGVQEDSLKHQSYASEYPRNRNYEDNEVLGSGNFAVVKGGTYYRKGGYRYRAHSNNDHPQTYNYYGSNNFNNFRDFADIKGDRPAKRYTY